MSDDSEFGLVVVFWNMILFKFQCTWVRSTVFTGLRERRSVSNYRTRVSLLYSKFVGKSRSLLHYIIRGSGLYVPIRSHTLL